MVLRCEESQQNTSSPPSSSLAKRSVGGTHLEMISHWLYNSLITSSIRITEKLGRAGSSTVGGGPLGRMLPENVFLPPGWLPALSSDIPCPHPTLSAP